jgi:hypothetical protein
MKNITRFILSILIIYFSLHLQAQDDISKSEWQSNEIKIDGKYDDWKIPFKSFDKNIGMKFEISNNNSHLFIFLMTIDPMKMSKLINSGMQIQISSKEKGRKFSASINIPGVQFEDQLNQKNPQAEQKKPNEKSSINDFIVLVSKYKLQLPGIKTKGFKTKNGDLPLIDKNGISVGIAADSIQNLCYEISLPFKELLAENLFQFNEVVQLNIKVNALVIPGEDKKNDEGISSNRTYAGMYGYVNNYRYMYGPSGAGEVNDMFRDNTSKFKFRLTHN